MTKQVTIINTSNHWNEDLVVKFTETFGAEVRSKVTLKPCQHVTLTHKQLDGVKLEWKTGEYPKNEPYPMWSNYGKRRQLFPRVTVQIAPEGGVHSLPIDQGPEEALETDLDCKPVPKHVRRQGAQEVECEK